MRVAVMSGYGQGGPRPGAPRWGRRAGGGYGPRAGTALCPYSGYGQPSEGELAREAYYSERLEDASRAAEQAAYQAEINAALAQQAHEFNRSIVVGFIGTGAVAVLMWAVTQAITAKKR